jgi:hypothetical protein
MAPTIISVRVAGWPQILVILAALFSLGQTKLLPAAVAQQTETPAARPLPDIPTLLRDVAKNQQILEGLRQLYTCHLSEEQDKVDSHGNVKSRTIKDYDVFYIGDQAALHLLATDGKPLTSSAKKDADGRPISPAIRKSGLKKKKRTKRGFPISSAPSFSRIRAAKPFAVTK